MKIKFDHLEEDIGKLFDGVEITEKTVDLTDEEIKEIMKAFADAIVMFDVGVLLQFFNVKNNTPILRISELIIAMIDDMGFEKFSDFTEQISMAVLQGQLEREGDDEDAVISEEEAIKQEADGEGQV